LSELARLTQEYRDYARFEMATHGSPIYAAICSGLADDPDVGGIGMLARPGFRTPLILLAAVHHLLLSGLDHPLAGYYPSLVGDTARPIDADLYPVFADLVHGHRPELEHLVATRTTQTNEAGRTVVTVPALGLVAQRETAPLALLEVGASAGLNLLPDRFGFSIGSRRVGDERSPVQISCAVEGELPPPVPTAMPRIAWRAGLDLNPLDVHDPDTVAWLRALIWPEHLDRMAILDAAVAIARDQPPALFRGDLVDDLAAVAAAVPGSPALVVIDTWVLAYVPAERRLAFVAELRRLARDLARPVWLVACEGQSVTASLDLGLGAAPAEGSGFSVLTLHRFEPGGSSEHSLLAECHAHGRWIRWLDPGTAGAA
jgi:hypothetical protein